MSQKKSSKWRAPMAVALTLTAAMALSAFNSLDEFRNRNLDVETAYIPAQCYTVTLDDDGSVSNTCYVCHQGGIVPNRVFDDDVQLEYAFPGSAMANPWTNTLEDRSSRIAAISDDEILNYIRYTNYFDESGDIELQGTVHAHEELVVRMPCTR